MQHDAGAFVTTITTLTTTTTPPPLPRPRTFLDSETAPDTCQIRGRLVEIRDVSRRRKHYAKCAVAGGTLIALILAQTAGARLR